MGGVDATTESAGDRAAAWGKKLFLLVHSTQTWTCPVIERPRRKVSCIRSGRAWGWIGSEKQRVDTAVHIPLSLSHSCPPLLLCCGSKKIGVG